MANGIKNLIKLACGQDSGTLHQLMIVADGHSALGSYQPWASNPGLYMAEEVMGCKPIGSIPLCFLCVVSCLEVPNLLEPLPGLLSQMGSD